MATVGGYKPEEKPKDDGKGKGKGKGKAPMTWDYVKEHMNEDHADSLIAYCVFFGGIPNVQKAVLTDVNTEGFFVCAELADGSKQDVKVPYEGGPIEGIDGVGKVMVSMSKKARDEVFVTCAPGISEKVTFSPFNDLIKQFREMCDQGEFAALAEMYMSDAVLVPQYPGPPPAHAPLVVGREAIKDFFEGKGSTLLKGLTLKTMRLYQRSEGEVTEIGRAWGSSGRPYCRQWLRAGWRWLLVHDSLPVLPPAVTL